MQVSDTFWRSYARKLSEISEKAGQKMEEYIAKYGIDDRQALIRYANALVQQYGDASSALASECYDLLASESGKTLPAAEPAEVSDYGEVAKAINGTLKQSITGAMVPSTVSRMVKQAGADTTLQNAVRDGAEWAWVPVSDTCAFCITLASRGWQHASKKVRKGLHANHIHANCDCTFAVRHDGKSSIEGYDPDKYLDMYYGAEGSTPEERINSMRRINYAANREKINAQKREAYQSRVGRETEPKTIVSLPQSGNSGIVNVKRVNYAKAIDSMIYTDDVDERKYTMEEILSEMQKSAVGRETIRIIRDNNVLIRIIDEKQQHDYRGSQDRSIIDIYSANNKSILNEAQTVIHEITHYTYHIGGCQHAEVICYGRELMHSRNKTQLSIDEWGEAISAVKEAYSDYEWEKGGYGDFEKIDQIVRPNLEW